MTDRKGAEAGATGEADSPNVDRVDILSKNFALLTQGIVNQHYEITRIQLLMDYLISGNPEIKFPDQDTIFTIEEQALKDTRKTYAHFLGPSPKSVDTDTADLNN